MTTEKTMITNKGDIARLLKQSKLKTKDVEISTDEGSFTVTVKEINGDTYLKLIQFASNMKTGEVDISKFYQYAIVDTVFYQGTNEKVFTLDDLDTIKEQSATILSPVINTISALNDVNSKN
jgi:hypothetical protein